MKPLTPEQRTALITQQVKVLTLGDNPSKKLIALILEENRQAWIRGKEYGWQKAWQWSKRKDADTSMIFCKKCGRNVTHLDPIDGYCPKCL